MCVRFNSLNIYMRPLF